MLSLNEKEVLKNLAERYATYASLPTHHEKRALWRALNRCEMQRPMILIDQIPWHEMDVDGSLTPQVSDPYWRNVEITLRQTLYKWEHMPADMVLDPYLCLPKVIECTGYGLEREEDIAALDAANDVVGHRYHNQITSFEDIEKIQTPIWTLQEAETQLIREEADELFKDILPVRMTGVSLHLGLWDFISQWMGVEAIYIDLMDRPELLHALMERMVSCTEHMVHQMDRDGLFDVQTHICHCSHTYCDNLPTPACDEDHPGAKDVWTYGMAQLLSLIHI